ncbi:secreted RxLR effector protein 161-like [Apium graveolens]|uniref:secreted RxLR effector protein 161-like n=1 Tax=Apium graveolens TaxID=4045 RepID=UPI003D7952B3
MIGCNPTKYPMDPKEQLTKDEGGKTVDTTQYKIMVGGLRYLVHTRPDISYVVGIISRYMERPTVLHQNAGGNNILTLAGNIDDRRSMSIGGMVFYLNENMITWMSQKQKCVALSSCEAEFMAATAALVKYTFLGFLIACSFYIIQKQMLQSKIAATSSEEMHIHQKLVGR